MLLPWQHTKRRYQQEPIGRPGGQSPRSLRFYPFSFSGAVNKRKFGDEVTREGSARC